MYEVNSRNGSEDFGSVKIVIFLSLLFLAVLFFSSGCVAPDEKKIPNGTEDTGQDLQMEEVIEKNDASEEAGLTLYVTSYSLIEENILLSVEIDSGLQNETKAKLVCDGKTKKIAVEPGGNAYDLLCNRTNEFRVSLRAGEYGDQVLVQLPGTLQTDESEPEVQADESGETSEETPKPSNRDVSIVSLTLSSTAPYDGEEVGFRTEIHSSGYDGTVTVEFYWDGSLVGSEDISLSPGITALAETDYNVSKGSHTLNTRIGLDDENQSNNELSKTVDVANFSELSVNWKADLGESITNRPAIYGEKIYVLTGSSIYEVDKASGDVTWSDSPQGSTIAWDVSPVIYKDLLFYGADGDGYVYAFNVTDKTYEWKKSTYYHSIFSSPEVSGDIIYIGSNDGNLHAITATGDRLWYKGLGSDVWVSPGVSGDTVYASSTGGNFYAIERNGGVRWNNQIGGVHYSKPLVEGGKVFVGAHDSKLYALDTSNGNVIWAYQTGGPIDSSPEYWDGKIYFGSTDGGVYALDLDGTKVWSYHTDSQISSDPVAHSGVIYIGSSKGVIYALNASTGEKECFYKTGGSVKGEGVGDGNIIMGSGDGYLYSFDPCKT